MRLSIKTCTLDMPFAAMLDFCVAQGVQAVEIGTGNWSGAPHIDLDELLGSETARQRWMDQLRRRNIALCALNCSGNPLAFQKDWEVTEKTFRLAKLLGVEKIVMMNALQMPYEYTSVDHLFEVLDGEIGQEVFETFKDNNLVGITYLHPGSRNFFNSKKEIHTPADLAGMKIRVSESDLMLTLMDCLGAAGVGLPFNDTYSSIQTNVVDGAENNMTSYIEMSFWEVAPYWTYDGHSYMPDMILASKQTMDKLSAEDQQIIFDCAKEAEVWHREAWEESESKNAKIAEEKGCTLTTLTDEEVKLFQDAVAPMYDSFLNADQKAIVERVQALG